MSHLKARLPLVDWLREEGYDLAQLTKTVVSDDPPMHSHYLAPVKDTAAEEVLIRLVNEFGYDDEGYTQDMVESLEHALREIKRVMEREFGGLAIVRLTQAFGSPEGEILRILERALNE